MAITRIRTDNIVDSAVTTDKLANQAVTAGKLADNLTYGSDLTVSGDLTVMGTTTTVESTTVTVADPLLVLASGQTGAAAVDAGLVIERGSDTNVAFIWDESADKFVAVNTSEDGATSGNVTITSYADLEVGTLDASTVNAGNLELTGNTLSATDANGSITLTPDGTGAVVVSSGHELQVADLDLNGIVFAGTDGALTTDTDFTFDSATGALAVSGEITVDNLKLDGNTLSATDTNGNLVLAANGTGYIDASGFVLTNLAAPGSNTDAATKLYVDNAVSAGGSTIGLDDSEVVVVDDGVNPGSIEFTVDGTTSMTASAAGLSVTGQIDADNLRLDGNTLSSTDTNGDIVLDPNGTGVVDVQGTLTVSSLTSGRVVYAGANGALTDESGFEYNDSTDTLSVGTVTASTGLAVTTFASGKMVFTTTNGALAVDNDVSYDSTTDTLTALNIVASTGLEVGNLTTGRVVLAGVDGALTDDAGLAFSSGALTTGDLTLSTSHGTGALTAVSGTFSGLTATRLVFAGTGGVLTDDADMTFDTATNTLSVDNVTSSGDISAASLTSTALTSGRVVLAGTGGELTDDAGLTYDASTDTLSVGTISVTNLTLDTLDVNVSATVATLTVEDLTAGRVVLAGASGAIVDDADLTFNSTTNTLDTPNLNISSSAVLASAAVSDLTSGRVVLAGASGELMDDAALTFDGTTDTLSATNISATDVDASTVSVSSLTSGRVVLAGASGELQDDAALTFDGATDTLSATNISATDVDAGDVSVSSLTSGRVVLAGASGALVDDSALTFDGTTDTLSATNISATDVDASTVSVSSLTSGRVVLVGASGELVDDADVTFSGDTLTATNISVGTQATLASAAVSDLTSGRVVLAGASGELVDESGLAYTVSTGAVALIVSGSVDVDNLKLDGNTLSSTNANGNIVLDPNGSGSIDASSAKITNLADPTSNQDAATKAYVDSATSAINSLTISDGSATDTVSLGTDTLEFAGTANEIETAVTDNTVTIGLPSDVTIGNDLTVTNDLTVSGDATITGNLTVNGTLTTISTTDTVIKDNTLVLNDGEAGAGVTAGTSGIEIDRGSADNATLLWNETTDEFQLKVGAAFATVKADTFIGDLTGDVTGTVSSLSNHDTDDLAEGTGNLYFTNTRARGAIGVTDSGGDGSLSYDSATGVITYSGPTDSDYRAAFSGGTGVSYDSNSGTFSIGQSVGTSDSVTFNVVTADLVGDVTGTVSDISNHDTDDLAEGTGNLYYTDSRARSAISVTDSGGDGSLSYNSSTGVLTYTGPSASDVRAHFSGGTGVDITNGVISIGQAVGTGDSVAFNSVNAGTLQANGLSAGLIVYTGINGVLEAESGFAYNATSNTLTADNVSATTLITTGVTDGRILYTSSGGQVTGDAAFTVDTSTDTLIATNFSASSGTVTAGTLSAGTIKSSGLTSGRVAFITTDGALTDDANFTFNATTDELSVVDLTASGAVTGGTLAATGLTSGRVVFATAGGELTDDSTFSFDAGNDTLTVTNLSVGTDATLASAKVSDLTAGRVVLAGTSGELEDSSSLLFDGGTGALTVTGSLAVDNISINGNTISSTDNNGNITLDPNGTGTVDVSSAKIVNLATPVSDYDAATKKYVDDAVSGNVTQIQQNNTSVEVIDNNVSAGVVDFTIDGVLQAKLTDTALEVYHSLEVDNLTFDGNTISSTDLNGDIRLAPNGSGNVVIDTGNALEVSDLGVGQIVYVGSGNVLATEAGFEYDDSTGTLSAANLEATSALTLTSFTQDNVLFVGAGGVVTENSNLTFTGSTLTLTGTGTVTGQFNADNVRLDGNTVSTTDSNGDLILQPNGTGSTVVNSAGNSSDFVVKSVNQAGMFVVDASADNIGIKTTTPNAGATLHVNATDSVIIPVGTQAQRPGTGATGMFRFNTTTSKLEVYNGTEWDSIGENQTTNITSETFSGDGSTVNFTLALSMTSASVIVSINGVVQIPGTAYSVSGTTLTFTEAPETGDTIEVRELVTTTLNQTVIGAEDGSSLVTYDEAGDQFSFTIANNAIVLVTSAGLDLRSGSAIICGDAATSVGTTATVVDSFAKADYRVAKYVAQVSNSGLGEYQAVELLVVHNGTTATVTEFGEVFTGSASLGSFSVTVNGANVEVKFTGANAGNAVKVMPTYIKA